MDSLQFIVIMLLIPVFEIINTLEAGWQVWWEVYYTLFPRGVLFFLYQQLRRVIFPRGLRRVWRRPHLI